MPYFEWRGGIERRTSVQAHLKSAGQKEGRDLPVGRKRRREVKRARNVRKYEQAILILGARAMRCPLRLVPGIHESNLGRYHEI
jgi:hypothetical protein